MQDDFYVGTQECSGKLFLDHINTASVSKVGQFRPFLRGSKKTKRSADEYFSFQIQECGSTTLETTLDAFCERSFNLLEATNAAI